MACSVHVRLLVWSVPRSSGVGCDRIATRRVGLASGGAVAAGIRLLCDWIAARRVGLHDFGVRRWVVTGRGAAGVSLLPTCPV